MSHACKAAPILWNVLIEWKHKAHNGDDLSNICVLMLLVGIAEYYACFHYEL